MLQLLPTLFTARVGPLKQLKSMLKSQGLSEELKHGLYGLGDWNWIGPMYLSFFRKASCHHINLQYLHSLMDCWIWVDVIQTAFTAISLNSENQQTESACQELTEMLSSALKMWVCRSCNNIFPIYFQELGFTTLVVSWESAATPATDLRRSGGQKIFGTCLFSKICQAVAVQLGNILELWKKKATKW